MKPITQPLNPGDHGADVTNLQDTLRLLLDRGLLQLPADQRASPDAMLTQDRRVQVYQDGTSRLVTFFQRQQNSEPTGGVDAPTAAALNKILKDLGVLDAQNSDTHCLVGGQVRREDGVPFKGGVVRAFHAGDAGALRLGEDTVDSQGRYTIRYELLPGADSVNLLVEVFDAAGELLQAAPLLPAAGPLEIVDLVVPSNDTVLYQVVGKVASRVSAGVGGLRVLLVDKAVGGDVLLIETVTNANGAYQASFSDASWRARGKAKPDLQTRVFAGATFLAASAVHYNATAQETLNVNLPANATALQSEHETLTGALAVHYNGPLGDLKETDEQQDITYLANKSGWDARAVALAALADQFSQRSGSANIPPVFFYALFRAGLPANEELLYHADAGTLAAVWNTAAAQGIMPQAVTAKIPAMVEQFQIISANKLLSGPALVGVSPLLELLSNSGLDDELPQQQFATLYTKHRTDLPAFWQTVETTFGPAIAQRLQVDGKLGFLTINNSPLMLQIHRAAGGNGLGDPLQLAQLGYHRAEKWNDLLKGGMPIPREMPGDTLAAQQANYAEYLAAQVRLSYPTAAVAEMVKSRALPLPGAADAAPDQVHAFLTEHQGKFEIGVQPVEQYIARNNVVVAAETLAQVKRLQRVYQLTPSDQAMTGLMQRGLDAAYHIVRYEKDAFVQTFAADLGGAEAAAQTYDKSVQVHNAVLNIAISYLTAKNGIALGTPPGPDTGGQILQPAPKGAATAPTNAMLRSADGAASASDVLAYPTLEGLFGSMDFCACDHCRSILSPAAYLVDLLQFIDLRNYDEHGVELPHTYEKGNPQDVLLARRPDLQHLPLTCENTNTALPYIDVVNETLEYFIANQAEKLSLDGYQGHDTDKAAAEDLLASPQFVMDAAYTILAAERFPAPLPFHQPLENLRRYFNKFEVPLPLAMERLRKNDVLDIDRKANPPPPLTDYGWRDIFMEELGLSRAEYGLLTVSTADPKVLGLIYGFDAGTDDEHAINELSNAKAFTRRLEITYDDIVAILQTLFVNPYSARIMRLIMLIDPTGSDNPCRFDNLEFRHVQPMTAVDDTSTRLNAVEFVRLLRFIRLWKKLGWTIEQIDTAICALLPPPAPSQAFADTVNTVAKLDAGFLTLLPRLGIIVRVMNALNLTVKRDLPALLTCWADIGTHGANALYRQMFLNPTLLKQDAVFNDNGYGEFLADAAQKLAAHTEALRSAFNLTGDEYDRIVAALGYNAATPLTIPNISAIFRHGWLARKLHLSVREFLLLIQLTGLDPFAAPDPTNPAILRLIDLVQAMKDRSLKSAAALYLIWNQDLSGKSAPDPVQVTEFARTLRGDFTLIEDQFAATEDPNGDIARARMALVYGTTTTDAFFALLDDTVVFDVAYTHTQATLQDTITAVDHKIAYDDFRHRLSRTGLLTITMRDALEAIAGMTPAFKNAVDALFARSEDVRGAFFARYLELQSLYATYITSLDPVAKKRATLLAAFQPELLRRRKQQQALQRFSTAATVDLAFTQALLNPTAAPYPLHAAEHANQPALNDMLALETPGLAVQFFFRDTATGAVDLSFPAVANLDYSSGSSNALPANPTPGNAISGIWRGQVETPDAGFYNFVIEADTDATVTLMLGGQTRPLTQNGNIRRNTDPLELKAGTLYDFVLTVAKVKDVLRIKWETPKRPREVIPSRYFYPPTIMAPFSATYLRFLKVVSLTSGLLLTANELAHFATDVDYQISNDGWLNVLPVNGAPTTSTATALLKPFQALLDYARIKAEVSPGDESLLTVLQDPATATRNADSLLYTLTRWDARSLNDLVAQFGSNLAGLTHFDLFRRVYAAFALVQKIGISASALIKATPNEPTGETVRALQAALRARYAAVDWRDVVQPINDELRGLQRDALVAYILHQLRSNSATAHIDTADELFEYFLMDVQMEPCMQTSRIRHALSSVQLFIERCLMNLEPDVSPASINAKQWTWMKRYRVWEANRKVFLWPENWLEPELRDDKSPFFKEIESELLQSDITEDMAATALLNYLAKLEEVAKLEPCGIHHVPGDLSKCTGDVDHVIARTAGAHRKYYYRRYEYGYWTPWEQVKLDIEDNPVVPVVWKDRLLLFWLRIIKESPMKPPPKVDQSSIGDPDAPSPTTKSNERVGNLTTDQLTTGMVSTVQKKIIGQTPDEVVKVTVKAVLCWSEYYNGKWQPTKTSDVNRPTELGSFPPAGPDAFDRSAIQLTTVEEGKEHYLRISIEGAAYSTFLLYNTHSLPIREEDAPHDVSAMFIAPRYLDTHANTFGIEYYQSTTALTPGFGGKTLKRRLLDNPIPGSTVETTHPLQNPWDAPFFFADTRHVFFVSTAEAPVLILNYSGYSISVDPGFNMAPKIPPLVIPLELETGGRPKFGDDGGTIGSGIGVTNPAPMQRFVTEDAYIRHGLGAGGTVLYGDKLITPAGTLS